METVVAFCKKISPIFFTIILLLIVSFTSISANQLDSLESELIGATGKERLVLLESLSSKLARLDAKRAEDLALEGIELAKSLKDSSSLFTLNLNWGGILISQNRLEEGIKCVTPALDYFKRKGQKRNIGRGSLILGAMYKSKRDYPLADSLLTIAVDQLTLAKDTALLISSYVQKGHIQYYQKNYEAANQYYSQNLSLAKMMNDSSLISVSLGNLGMIQGKLSNYPQALEYYFQSLKLAHDDLSRASDLNNISNIYIKLKDWKAALKYQEEALAIKEKLGFPLPIARSLDNLGVIHKNMLNYGEALKNCKKALALKEEMEGKENSIENTLNNLGNIYMRIGDYENSLIYHQRSLNVCLEQDNQVGVGRAYHNIANVKYKTKKYTEAIPLALKSLDIAQQRKNLSTRMIRYELLADIHKAMGNHKEALMYSNSFNLLKDSIYSIENLRKVAELENESYQKGLLAENEKLKKEETINLLQLKKYQWLFGLGSIILLLILFYFYKETKQNKKIEQTLTEKQEDLTIHKRFDRLQEILLAQANVPQAKPLEEENQTSIDNPQLTRMSDFLIDNLNTKQDWAAFEHYFTRVHVNFFKELKTSFPNLTTNDLNLCALIRLNLLNNEIGEIMGINADSARRAQYRLAKKMNLMNNDALRTFLLKV